jgi:hypothetical protein
MCVDPAPAGSIQTDAAVIFVLSECPDARCPGGNDDKFAEVFREFLGEDHLDRIMGMAARTTSAAGDRDLVSLAGEFLGMGVLVQVSEFTHGGTRTSMVWNLARSP